jgi:CD80-like C2-set immunoglobulin domain
VYRYIVLRVFTISILFRSRFAQLTVYVPPGDPLIVQGGVIQADEGAATVIQCISPGGKPAADILWYDGDGDVVMNNVELRTIRLEDGKRFNTSSVVSFTADRRHHNRTFTCSASNIADRSRRTVSVLIVVRYAPSVRLTPSRDVAVEGETVSYSCRAHANPPPARFSWWVDGAEAPGFNSNFFLIANISR